MKFIRALYLIAALSASSTGMMAQTQSSGYFLHTITKGQSLYSIASMYNVTTGDIVKMNPGSDQKIKTGETLKIPQKNIGTEQQMFHTIQSGETLYKLTQRYGVTAQRICQANPGLSAENFRIGQVIVIPAKVTDSEEIIMNEVKAAQTIRPATTSTPLKPNCRDMHKVERKETIFSISRLYGITEAELIAANPELRTEKLKKGRFLCIPYPKDTKTETPVDNTPAVIPTDDQLFNESKKEARKISTIKAAVMLPFMTDGKGNRDEQTRMVEYYEGFLMAVDSLKEKGVSIDLYSYDTHNNTSSIKNILDRSELKSMDIIFGPAYPDQVKPVAEFAKKNNIRLVVPFTSKGNEVFSNPAIYQINTPQSYLYSEVYEHFTRKFTTANVIFLDAEDGDKDKVDFIKGLKEELKTKRIPFTELKGENITPESLKGAMNHSMDNVFIPTSGTNVALIKLLPQLIVTSRDNPDYRMQLFGYPEWQTYTNDHLASFYELDTYFYSSFYTNNLFPEAVQFSSAYRKWYSKDMLNSFPKYGMLGFDTGYFFLKGLSQYGNKLEGKLDKVAVTPIQTGFKFERVNNWGGFINRKVFFVHFTKDFELIKLDFE
ncbi:LysM peptidoglycan-binding domain-containing protein [Phocaeicola vulgatus]|uniref:PBP1 and LysM peptidoglycan-binding domain-containing protein n=1 Tax=Phocaeicola vulgatus TaxID=821 RepID=UPI002165F243|nr:LysM peptidoglycan-binding domain-containing protein [Phocaeicola vulgatus]MCS2316188.1 LysM peptidoglycan-binding domain-containing protein [Phocaeicola vulgatus]